MAYMNQEHKAQIAPVVKKICKKYGVNASLAVRNHSTLVLNIKSGVIDFIGNFNENIDVRDPTGSLGYRKADHSLDVNPYWYKEYYSGKTLAFLTEIFTAMNNGNHDRSDIQSDYFDVGWYVDVNVGQWNKPYLLIK